MSPERYIFRKKQRWYSSPLYIFTLSFLILIGLFFTQGFRRGDVQPLFMPTPTATRIAGSYSQEADTNFQAGSLDAAIKSYKDAIVVNPDNGRLYAELARILTYSTESQTTSQEKQTRFDEALKAAKKATELAPEDSTVFAVQAFALDWYASFVNLILKDEEQGTKLLTQAEQSVSKAITLDKNNVLAQVYYAEILIDQQRFDQAVGFLQLALKAEPNLWDAHRVNALFLETQGRYMDSINEFETAIKLAPNMTFLYIRLGMSYRNIALKTNSKDYYEKAIASFAKAAALNEQLGIKDPMPYLGIGRAYAQEGEFYVASLNMNKAIQYNPYDPDVYAQLGMVYRQARNYEDAIKALKCGVRGCTAAESCDLRSCNPDVDLAIEIKGQSLSGQTLVYYYTYASLLAGMYLPGDPKRETYCNDSKNLITQIRSSSFGSDSTVTSILNESEAICNAMLAAPSAPLISPTPTATGRPVTMPTRGAKLTETPTPKAPPKKLPLP